MGLAAPFWFFLDCLQVPSTSIPSISSSSSSSSIVSMVLPRSSSRDLMTWGSTLEFEPEEVSRRAKAIFQRAKSTLSVESGRGIAGISGNDRALACLCLCIVKLPTLALSDRKALETSLQRTSGVKPRVFSNALKELPLILEITSQKPSPYPNHSNTNSQSLQTAPVGEKNILKRSPTKAYGHSGDDGQMRSSLIKSSPLKRVASSLPDSESDECLMTPTNKKRIRTIDVEAQPSSSKISSANSILASNSRTPRSTRMDELSGIGRTITKTPLNLPIQRPPKPMCIFQSHPIFNPRKSPCRLNFSDWNWKSKLFRHEWSLDDIREWQKWNQKSIENSLA